MDDEYTLCGVGKVFFQTTTYFKELPSSKFQVFKASDNGIPNLQ